MVRSFSFLSFCARMAAKPPFRFSGVWDFFPASVNRYVGLPSTKWLFMQCSASFCLTSLKADSCLGSHINFPLLDTRSLRGRTISAYRGMKQSFHMHMQTKELSSSLDVGGFAFLIKSTFFGSGDIPSEVNTIPKNLTFLSPI